MKNMGRRSLISMEILRNNFETYLCADGVVRKF